MHACSLRGLCLTLVVLGLGLPSAAQEGLDKNGTGVKQGRIYYYHQDSGPIGEDTAYRRAFADYTQRNNFEHGRGQGTTPQLAFMGRCYCWVKQALPGTAKRDQRTIAEHATTQCLPRTQLAQVPMRTVADVVMTMADKILCPTGYPNPITANPDDPPALPPAAHGGGT